MPTDEEKLAELRKEERKTEFKALFIEAMTEWVEAHKPEPEPEPAPKRTEKKAGGFLEGLFS